MEIPIKLSIISPKIAKGNKIADAIMTYLLVTRRRSFFDSSCVKEKKIGVIAELYLEKRGTRNVALARINEIVKSKNNLSLLGREKEILVVSLQVLSKVSKENEQLSV